MSILRGDFPLIPNEKQERGQTANLQKLSILR